MVSSSRITKMHAKRTGSASDNGRGPLLSDNLWQQAIQGFVIVVAIILNAVVDRRNRRLFARRILRE